MSSVHNDHLLRNLVFIYRYNQDYRFLSCIPKDLNRPFNFSSYTFNKS